MAAPKKTTTKRKPGTVEPGTVATLRDITPDIWEGVERETARRQPAADALGATLTKNSMMLAVMRAGIEALDAKAAKAAIATQSESK
jgi:hypothetical protein